MAGTVMVDVGAESYTIYGEDEEWDVYLGASMHADNWRTATTEQKMRALVTATRLLDRQRWLGDKTADDQELAWPRTNTGIVGVEDAVIPQNVINAAFELALALIDGSEAQNEQNTSQKIQSLSAGSVSISYFRGAEGPVRRFSQIVHELLRGYLVSGSVSLQGVAVGVDGESVTAQDFTLNRGL